MADEFEIEGAGVRLAGETAGDGPPVVLLHGLTATRRYVVMGSRSLERSRHRVISYDARGHGRSSGSQPAGRYGYEDLTDDLLAILDAQDVDRAVLAGVSMGAHTLLRFALDHPQRVAGLVVITPGFRAGPLDPARLAHWDALALGLRANGIDGFVAAYDLDEVAPALRDTVVTVIRQRMALHADLAAVADALQAVPRSAPLAAIDELSAISVPVTVIASGDGADPEHPQAIAEAYAAAIPDAELLLDDPGRSPRAWQGSQVSQVIAAVVERSGL
jgi:pimeloyl-ACP methyl ester carboxylesterase